jgi:broad specificity phosphatase PhoE
MKRIARAGFAWMLIARLYLIVAGRYWRWRIRLWREQWRIDGNGSKPVTMKQLLLFIRHGESTWNAEGLLPGQLAGIALTDKGRKQAAALAESLTDLPISLLVSSPLERASETAAIIAARRDLTIQLEPRLMDTDIGQWAGKKHDELGKTDPVWRAFVQNPAVAPEGVESFPTVQRRALEAVEYWRKQENAGKYVAFVSHADVIKVLIAHYTGLDAALAGKMLIENASASVVLIDDEAVQPARVIAIGWARHPGWLKPILDEQEQQDAVNPLPNGEQKT